MKTQNEILSDIYKLVQTTPIAALSGAVYKRTRLTNSILEDCVLSLISGTNAKFLQNAALYTKIFYKDLNIDNTYYEDAINGQSIEILLWNLSESLLTMDGYSFDVMSREIYSEAVEEIHQHYVILKMNFQLTIH